MDTSHRWSTQSGESLRQATLCERFISHRQNGAGHEQRNDMALACVRGYAGARAPANSLEATSSSTSPTSSTFPRESWSIALGRLTHPPIFAASYSDDALVNRSLDAVILLDINLGQLVILNA